MEYSIWGIFRHRLICCIYISIIYIYIYISLSLSKNWSISFIVTILMLCHFIHYVIGGDSSIFPLFILKFSNMSLFWNNLDPCPCFKTRFSQNRVSMKNSICRKSSMGWSNLKRKKKKKKIAWNSSSWSSSSI